jgi:hypothetical protein
MPLIKKSDIPPDSDDIGQSAIVGQLIATGSEEMNPPFKTGDVISSINQNVRLQTDRGVISSRCLVRKKITGIFYSREILETEKEISTVGWCITFGDFKSVFRACYFQQAT